MTGKVIFQAVLSIIAGAAFIAVGIYFLASKAEAGNEKNAFRAKGCGLTTLALGALTLVHALLLFTFPVAASWLSLVYLCFVMIAVLVIVVIFR
jgi:hypothetical protein